MEIPKYAFRHILGNESCYEDKNCNFGISNLYLQTDLLFINKSSYHFSL